MNKIPKIYICNAFALSMLDREQQSAEIYYGTVIGNKVVYPRTPRPVADPKAYLANFGQEGAHIVSALGHESTRGIFESALDRSVPVNRMNVRLEDGDLALIGQYVGPRLEEGATELPDGATLEWWVI